jgi:hypothetical protein
MALSRRAQLYVLYVPSSVLNEDVVLPVLWNSCCALLEMVAIEAIHQTVVCGSFSLINAVRGSKWFHSWNLQRFWTLWTFFLRKLGLLASVMSTSLVSSSPLVIASHLILLTRKTCHLSVSLPFILVPVLAPRNLWIRVC